MDASHEGATLRYSAPSGQRMILGHITRAFSPGYPIVGLQPVANLDTESEEVLDNIKRQMSPADGETSP